MRASWLLIFVVAAVCPAQAEPAVASDSAPVDFARDVAPLLRERCERCHGPRRQRKNLRLDAPAAILAGGRSGPAVVPGDSARSRLIRHVTGAGGARRMPPEGAPLSEAQIDVLRRWIDAGAPLPPDASTRPDLRPWAYRPLQAEAPPPLDDASGCRNEIDRFVRARLAREGLAPAAEADRVTLIRRVSLDLVGLPPTPEEVDAFVADARPDAYERVVDRLLASEHFGERWAQLWLDLARYADTKGYEKDARRSIWPYRDWVIRAFDADMPFDRFTVEQIAGDLLPDPTEDQLIATAFHRNTMTNDEGGTDDEEFRVAAVVDRVNTTMQVWMGTTAGCAQCHDHKYDPLSQREYYELFAVLNNTQDRDAPDESPTLPFHSAADRQRRELLRAVLARQEALLEELLDEFDAARADWQRERRAALAHYAEMAVSTTPWEHAGPYEAETFAAAFATANGPEPGASSEVAIDWQPRPQWEDGAVHVGLSGDRAAHYLRREVNAVVAGPATLSLGSDDAIKVWVNGVEVLARQVSRAAALDQDRVTVDLRAGGNEVLLKIVNGSGPSGFSFALRPLDSSAAFVELLAVDEPTPEQDRELRRAFGEQAAEFAGVRAGIESTRQQLAEIRPAARVPIMRENLDADRRQTHVHVRGSFLSHGEPVEPGVPAAFPPLPSGAEPTRLRFARWLVSDANPLTPRVMANRLWEQLFGRGLVESSEDFGTQCEPPSHPALLDWLARRFVERGWSIKGLLRDIVVSATYRQSSRSRPELRDIDPRNLLLARGARVRLAAETIRDQALAVSGLLDLTRFGPSVMPPQPDGVWQVVYSNDSWRTSQGADRYRRGVYTFWRRTSPYPSAIAFDAPSREICVVRRIPTNTPLQALVTLNDPVFVEAARALARRMQAADRPLEFGFRACLGRVPTASELRELQALLADERGRFAAAPREAAELAATDAAGSDDLAELAALTVVGNVLLNLDAFLVRS